MLRALLAASVALVVAVPVARADRLSGLSRQLKSENSKVRLSAVLALSRNRSAKSASALARTLRKDREATVRKVAAASLGKMAPELDPSSRKKALSALRVAARRDRNAAVRKVARLASRSSIPRETSPRATRAAKQVVSISPVSGRVPRGSQDQLHQAVERIVTKLAPGYEVQRRSKRAKASPNAYTLASRVRHLKIVRRGSRAEVRCSVQVLVAPTDSRGRETLGAGRSATASGNGQVVTRGNRRGIERGSRQCVLAVVEQVTRRQVMPFLASRD